MENRLVQDPIIARIPLTDGCVRDVHQMSDGRQYVIDGAGLRVFGVWILERDAADTGVNGRVCRPS